MSSALEGVFTGSKNGSAGLISEENLFLSWLPGRKSDEAPGWGTGGESKIFKP